MIEEFETHLRNDLGFSPRTIRSYLSDVRAFGQWYEYSTDKLFRLRDISHATISLYQTTLVERLKPASINRHIYSLRKFFGWAVAVGIIDHDPMLEIRQVKEIPSLPRHISDQEEASLMSAVREHGSIRDQVIITLLLHTGIRTSELRST